MQRQYEETFGVTKWEFEVLCMLYCAKKHGVDWVAQLTAAEVATQSSVAAIYPSIVNASASLYRQGFVERKRKKVNDGWCDTVCTRLSLTDNGKNKVESWLT